MRSICKKGPAILVAVLALCAITAASASATTATWYVGGKALTGLAALAEAAKVEENVTFTMPTEGTKHIKLVCTSLNTGKSQITAPDIATFSNLKLGGCKITEGTECSVENEELLTRTTLGMEVTKLGSPLSHEDNAALKPEAGTTLFGYLSAFGSGCSLPSQWPLAFVEKNLNLKMTSGQTEAAEQPFVGLGEKEHLEWAGKPIYLSGKFKLKLASGKAWSFH